MLRYKLGLGFYQWSIIGW